MNPTPVVTEDAKRVMHIKHLAQCWPHYRCSTRVNWCSTIIDLEEWVEGNTIRKL